MQEQTTDAKSVEGAFATMNIVENWSAWSAA